jgi:hypothetical protein
MVDGAFKLEINERPRTVVDGKSQVRALLHNPTRTLVLAPHEIMLLSALHFLIVT